MEERRQLGRITTFEISYPTESSAMESKFRIAELLDLPINCVEWFRDRAFSARTEEAGSLRG